MAPLPLGLLWSFIISQFHLLMQRDWRFGFPGGSDGKASACNVGDSV